MSDNMGNDEDEHQENINDEMADGGGCVEAWNAMAENRRGADTEHTRRAAIKILSAGAVSVAGFGTVSGQTTTNGTSESTTQEGIFTEINGKKAKKISSKASKSGVFKSLKKSIQKEEGYLPVKNEPTVLKTKEEDKEKDYLVVFGLKALGKAKEDTVNSDVTIAIKDGEVISGKSSIVNKEGIDQDSIKVYVKNYGTAGEDIQSATGEALVELDPDNPNEKYVSVASRSAECFACQTVGDAVCAVGCGWGVNAACAGTAVANLGAGATCGVIASALCVVFTATHDRYTGASCAGDFGIELACYYAGYCDDPI